MNRRSFLGRMAVAVFVPLAVVTTGCSWQSEIESIIPTALKALSLLLGMISNAGVTLGAGVENVIGQINTTAGEVLTALQSGPLTGSVLNQVITALNDFLTYFQNLIQLLPPLPATIVDLVAGGIEIILSTIQGYLENPPMPVSASVTRTPLAKIAAIRGTVLKTVGGSPRTVSFTGIKRNRSSFERAWNKQMPAAYRLHESVHI